MPDVSTTRFPVARSLVVSIPVSFLHRRLRFAVWWFVLLALHVVNVVYYVGAAVLYEQVRNTNLEFQLTLYSIGISFHEWPKISAIHLAVAAVHAVFIVLMIVGSLKSRRLVFYPTCNWLRASHWSTVARVFYKFVARTPIQDVECVGAVPSRPHRQSLSKITESLVGTGSAVFGREGLLGVDSAYFDHLHLARELVETALQTVQAYRMSYLLPRAWLIRFYVALLVANCWSTPILVRYYRDRQAERRMMSLLCDAVLDLMSSIGVSLWIFITYLPQYTDPMFGFPFASWFEDVWFTNMQQEFQMLLVVSWADMASRLVFALGLLQCMDAIKDMLMLPRSATDAATRSTIAVVPAMVSSTRSVHPVSVNLAHGPSETESSRKFRWWLRPLLPRLVEFVRRVEPRVFFFWGFAILAIHGVAEFHHNYSSLPCELRLQPWFVRKPACSLVEINCQALGYLSGSLDSINNVWDTFESSAAARVVVRHCPQLVVPPIIQRFSSLTGFKIYNSTVVAWPLEAALTHSAHPHVRVVYLVRCHLPNGELPQGLLSDHFPRGVKSVLTSVTNLKALPENLHLLWPQHMALGFELSSIDFIPSSVIQLNPTLISFAGSPIVSVPGELFEVPMLECVLLSYTNIQELPRTSRVQATCGISYFCKAQTSRHSGRGWTRSSSTRCSLRASSSTRMRPRTATNYSRSLQGARLISLIVLDLAIERILRTS